MKHDLPNLDMAFHVKFKAIITILPPMLLLDRFRASISGPQNPLPTGPQRWKLVEQHADSEPPPVAQKMCRCYNAWDIYVYL